MKSLLISLGTLISIWGLLFIFFVMDAASFRNVFDDQCDNIVVLTGGKNRIKHALDAIRIHKPKNLFISGVHEKTKLDDIISASEKQKDVNFILGKQAKNTFENAEEIENWVNSNDIKKIVLVTSDYHMRRGLLVIKNENKYLEIIPCASKSKFNFLFLKMCIKEFHKTLYVYIKMLFDKFRRQNLDKN